MWRLCAVPVVLLATVLFAQTNQQSQPEGQQAPAWRPLEETKPGDFVIPPAFGRKGAGYRLVSWSESPPKDSKSGSPDE